jgi:hypothetical protein
MTAKSINSICSAANRGKRRLPASWRGFDEKRMAAVFGSQPEGAKWKDQ